ncbi:lactate utilization protein C [Halioxenophilus sp. WMMB6]|uniref:LutC/YkgG family protein n=1 Tax=Halioxenophilus sp. WMMB6 TaxID=3073815 RepID=UPI00295F3DC0|nr:LUD domain-containing protein [Halioxenophilus sp. WMMB6]
MDSQSDFRTRLFAKIAQANGKQSLPENLTASFQQLINGTKGQQSGLAPIADCLAAFKENARLAACELFEVISLSEINTLLSERMPAGANLMVSPQPALQPCEWSVATTDNAREAQWGLALAEIAIAETGSVCLHSEAVATGLLYLVETLIVVVQQSQIVARQEEAWQQMHIGTGQRPRALHMITGPSRTADVEQMLQLGAHGPREVLIFILAN